MNMVLAFLKNTFGRKGSNLASVLLAFCSVFIVTALYFNQNQFLESFEAKSYDLRFSSLRGAIAPYPNIGLITIDDKSIAEFGRFPWSRVQYVKLLQRLTAAGAKAVLFDVTFTEPESKSIDQSLAAAIAQARNVGLAVTFDFDKNFQVVNSGHSLPALEKGAAGVGHINLIPEDDGVFRRNQLFVEVDGKKVPSLGLLGAMMAGGYKDFDT